MNARTEEYTEFQIATVVGRIRCCLDLGSKPLSNRISSHQRLVAIKETKPIPIGLVVVKPDI